MASRYFARIIQDEFFHFSQTNNTFLEALYILPALVGHCLFNDCPLNGILEHEFIILPQCAALCGSYRNEFPQEKKTFDDSRRHKAVGRPKKPGGE